MSSPGIIFYGTPDFAVPSLERLVANRYKILAVVTSPDKPAGRGLKMQTSAVKDAAVQHGIPVLQPVSLRDPGFLEELKSLHPDLQIVVAFRMMPREVWQLPSMGTFNLHASLLPDYRGAAPINWAIINGEKETGVTTFFLRHEIDTGAIIMQEKVSIDENDTAGTLHDKLKDVGANLVVKTVEAIEKNKFDLTEQEKLISGSLKPAPKLNRENTKIRFDKRPDEIRNFIRGLSPYPGAHAELITAGNQLTLMIKLYSVEAEFLKHEKPIGSILTDHKNYLMVHVQGGIILVHEIQIAGKSKMTIKAFLNGFKMEGEWRFS